MLLVLVMSGAGSARPAADDTPHWVALRRRMVAEQLRGRDITDPRVLDAMERVPRQAFVPESLRPDAYADRALPIGGGQTISQPYIVALMSQLLALRGSERVLEIGTGSGYHAAVLSCLAHEVYSIEIDPQLAASARERLVALGFATVNVRAGDGFLGWPEAAPFDAIVGTAAAPRVPEPLVAQLREGGRLVMPIGSGDDQQLMAGVKHEGRLSLRSVTDVLFVPMTGKVRTPEPVPAPTLRKDPLPPGEGSR